MSLKCAGPQMLISPPAFSSSRARPERSVMSLPLATTVGDASRSTPVGVVVATSRSSPSIRPMTAGKSCAEVEEPRKESVAMIASNEAAKITLQTVARCFLRIVGENKFTYSFLKGGLPLIETPSSTYTITACQNK